MGQTQKGKRGVNNSMQSFVHVIVAIIVIVIVALIVFDVSHLRRVAGCRTPTIPLPAQEGTLLRAHEDEFNK